MQAVDHVLSASDFPFVLLGHAGVRFTRDGQDVGSISRTIPLP